MSPEPKCTNVYFVIPTTNNLKILHYQKQLIINNDILNSKTADPHI